MRAVGDEDEIFWRNGIDFDFPPQTSLLSHHLSHEQTLSFKLPKLNLALVSIQFGTTNPNFYVCFRAKFGVQELQKRSNSRHHIVTSVSEVRSGVQKTLSATAWPGETDLSKEF